MIHNNYTLLIFIVKYYIINNLIQVYLALTNLSVIKI